MKNHTVENEYNMLYYRQFFTEMLFKRAFHINHFRNVCLHDSLFKAQLEKETVFVWETNYEDAPEQKVKFQCNFNRILQIFQIRYDS